MSELTYVQKLEKDYLRIEAENRCYREALGFYANRISYLQVIPNGQSNIEHGKGKKARQALESEEN